MKKYIKIGLYISISISLVAGIYVYYIYKSIERSVEEMQITFGDVPVPQGIMNDITKSNERKSEGDIEEKEEKESLLFLLLGIGDRPGDPGRADSIILISLNQLHKSAIMFNITRDTRTEIVGKGIQDKINHSYAYGRTEMTKNTVEHFLNHPIDYVIQVNMEGIKQLVDEIGGIEVMNEFSFSERDEHGDKIFYYDKGLIQLDGERALHYSRMRKQDPRGDFGRNERQRQVLMALLQKATSLSSVFKIQEILDILGSNIKTNITFEEMKSFYAEFKKEWNNLEIESIEISGTDIYIDEIYYYKVSEAERERISNLLKEHANLSQSINPNNN